MIALLIVAFPLGVACFVARHPESKFSTGR